MGSDMGKRVVSITTKRMLRTYSSNAGSKDVRGKGKAVENYTANIRIRDLDRDVDLNIEWNAIMQGKMKWEIVKEALEEYAARHPVEIRDAG